MPVDKNHPITLALDKTRISIRLKREFIKFLEDSPDWEKQAIYLLKDKKQRIERIIFDLFGVPVKEQINWKKNIEKAELDDEIIDIIQNYEQEKDELKIIRRQHLFKDWKQEHGFESIPPEIGDIHTVIRLKKTHSDNLGPAIIWYFNRNRFGKRGWGNERLIKNPRLSLLDNNNNPGWSVRQYLEENTCAEAYTGDLIEDPQSDIDNDDSYFPEETQPTIENGEDNHSGSQTKTLLNPIVYSSYDSQNLLYILFGHPLLYAGNSNQPIRNALKTAKFILNYFPMKGYLLFWGSFTVKSDGKSININPEDILECEDNIFLYGTPPGIIYDALFYQVNETVMSPRLIEGSLRSVMVPNDEKDEFFEKFRETYDHIELVECQSEESMPGVSIRNIRSWKNWIADPECRIPMFQTEEDAVKITLDQKTEDYKSNKIALLVENLENWEDRIINREKVSQYETLFKLLEKIIAGKNTEQGAYIFERISISQILSLSEGYPYAFGFDGKPLVSDQKFQFRITVKTQKNEQKKFSLTGRLIYSENGKTKILQNGESNEEKINTFGMVPCFHLFNGQMCRVENYCSGRLVNDSLTGIHVDETEIVDFYATAIPYLKQRGITISDPEGLLRVSALFSYHLFASMHIRELKGILMGRLSIKAKTDIGEFDYPMYSEKDEFSPVVDSVSYHVPRNFILEQNLLETVYGHGWVDETDGDYSMRFEKVMSFFMDILPHLPEDSNIVYTGVEDLKKWKIQEINPSISTKIKTNIDWFDINVKIEFDGHAIDIQQILKFWRSPKIAIELKGKDELVVINKEWLSKFAPILNRLIEINKIKNDDVTETIETRVKKYHVGLISELEAAAAKKDTDRKWKTTVQKLKDYKEENEIFIPDCVKAVMRDYQIEGVRWLLFLREFKFGGILADDMGLGKTLQILCFLAICKERNDFTLPNMVIVPTSVSSNWINEINKFVPHFKVVLLYGVGRKELFRKINGADLVITTYGLIQRDVDELKAYKFDILILDEAQMIKNSRSKTSTSISKIRSKMRLSLSGTPIENSVSELWSHFNFLMPGFLGNLKNFQSIYINTFQKNSEKKREAYSFLRRQTRSFILRRMKQQVAKELPPKTEQMLYCEMNDGQRKLYNSVLDIVRKKIKDKIDSDGFNQAKITIFDALTRLRQICSDPRLSKLTDDNPPESAKLTLFTDIVSEIVSEGHRILVFSHFVKMLNLMHEPLNKMNIPFLQLDGSTKKRGEQVSKFQNDDYYPVMLISLKAGGVGINLTAADYVIHYDPWWNPAAEAQATDRAYRIGQNNQVFVYKLVTRNSIEEKIIELQSMKLSVAEEVIGISDKVDSMLNLDSIREIFQF